MKEFSDLIEISEKLLGPEGCPWDREQTLRTLQPYLLEEVHELLEALDAQEGPQIAEELGDVFYTLVFIGQLGKQSKIFTLSQALQEVSEKLIRRHPHVFGEVQAATTAQIEQNWEKIKKQEGKGGGIPPTLPSLARAQKILIKLKRAQKGEGAEPITEGELGSALWELVKRAEVSGLDAESVLRRYAENKKSALERDS